MYYTRNRAEDGAHYHVHKTLDDVKAYLEKQIGRPVGDLGVADRKVWIDDWGRVFSFGLLPGSITTAEEMNLLEEAFDARECGVETPAQIELLARAGY